MGRIIFITGGSRSGKSSYAQTLAEGMEGPRVYIATAPALDDEMKTRIRTHKKVREGKGWITIEEGTDIVGAIESAGKRGRVLLVECVTLWVNNLMYEAERLNRTVTETKVVELAKRAVAAGRAMDCTLIFVSNEVGWGVIPDNPLARRFVDIAGRVNQAIALESDEAILIISGMPLKLK